MDAKNRLSDAIVLMLIVLMWTALLMIAAYLAFQWMVENFGRQIAIVSVFALGGVVLSVFLWIASSRHTTAIWRSALNYAADTHDANVQALRSLSAVQREDARTHRIREQAQAQIGVASYRAALADARQAVRQELRIEQQQPPQPAVRSWTMTDDDDFQWSQ